MTGTTPAGTEHPHSGYLDYLPAVFRAEPFTGRFLLAFEAMLSGLEGHPGLGTVVDRIADFFDPDLTEPDFLPWLADWVALSLRADWDERTRRDFIGRIVPLYRSRGTRAGLRQLLELYTGQRVEVHDSLDEPPFFFEVEMTLGTTDPKEQGSAERIARVIIDQEKPAHTYYALRIRVPRMRLVSPKQHADEGWPMLSVGVNTVLGTMPWQEKGDTDD